MAWLRLIRWQNLVIIFLAQFFAWRFVILPERSLLTDGHTLLLSAPSFLLLSLSTMLIAAAGYIINDYFDIRIDLINRPEKMVLGKTIPSRTAIILHAALNIAALVMAGYLARKGGHYEWLLLQLGCIVLLWVYSTHLKRRFMTGNIAIAILTALTILVLMVYEPWLHFSAARSLINENAAGPSSLPSWILVVYAYFAFMLTWMREIVKDMEDLKGDEAEGCVTMPIKLGLRSSAIFTIVLALLAVIPLCIAAYVLLQRQYELLPFYIVTCLVIPLILWSVFLGRDATPQHYHKASRGLKIIMLLGICSLLIYHFQINLTGAE